MNCFYIHGNLITSKQIVVIFNSIYSHLTNYLYIKQNLFTFHNANLRSTNHFSLSTSSTMACEQIS